MQELARKTAIALRPPSVQEAAPGVVSVRIIFVNVIFIGERGGPWVLVDAGLRGSAARIRRLAEEHFGAGARPEAIILTHGHFDHVGALQELAQTWDVPVYAHSLELPYLTGQSAYPPADPTVGGGSMAWLSFLYPNDPIDLDDRVQALPSNGSVPGLPEWKWIHTPGHAPGHVSLFRESDRTLVSGDAVVTTKQESALSVLLQSPELHGPPMYFTHDWAAARNSVLKLTGLKPEILVSGHGQVMQGEELRQALDELATNFDELAVPMQGRYVNQPALTDETGVVSLPEAPESHNRQILAGAGIAVVVGLALTAWLGTRNRGGRDEDEAVETPIVRRKTTASRTKKTGTRTSTKSR